MSIRDMVFAASSQDDRSRIEALESANALLLAVAKAAGAIRECIRAGKPIDGALYERVDDALDNLSDAGVRIDE